MNLDFLETFIDLAETLNFSKTAKNLNTSQSAVSRQIKTIEGQTGMALFVRSKRRVSLSREGQDFLRSIKDPYLQLTSHLSRSTIPTRKQKQKIKIGTMFESGHSLLMPAIAKLRSQDWQLVIEMLPMRQIMEQIDEGKMDVGMVGLAPDKKSIVSLPVYEDRPLLVGYQDLRSTPEEMEQIPFITYREDDQYFRDYIGRFLGRKDQNKIRVLASVNSHSAMVLLAEELKAFTLIPESSYRNLPQHRRVKIFQTDAKGNKLSLIHHESMLQNEEKVRFLKDLRAQFGRA